METPPRASALKISIVAPATGQADASVCIVEATPRLGRYPTGNIETPPRRHLRHHVSSSLTPSASNRRLGLWRAVLRNDCDTVSKILVDDPLVLVTRPPGMFEMLARRPVRTGLLRTRCVTLMLDYGASAETLARLLLRKDSSLCLVELLTGRGASTNLVAKQLALMCELEACQALGCRGLRPLSLEVHLLVYAFLVPLCLLKLS